MHELDELINSYAKDSYDRHILEKEVLDVYEGNVGWCDCSWRTKVILARWIKGEELKSIYNNQFRS
jgi:hypothetical protein